MISYVYKLQGFSEVLSYIFCYKAVLIDKTYVLALVHQMQGDI